MKVINSNVEIYQQEPGFEGMWKQIERVGRMCYKSEDKITDISYIKFVERMIENGHWAVLEFGTVYIALTVDQDMIDSEYDPHTIPLAYFLNNPKARCVWNNNTNTMYITTNFRYICQLATEHPELDLINKVRKYWRDPEIDSMHQLRICTHWTTSRFVAAQALRHRVFSMMQESQRYCNYSRVNKFSEGVQFITPYWAKKLANTYGIDENSKTLWDDLIKLEDKSVISRNEYWKSCEKEYQKEIEMGLLPEEARGCLCNDAKTEFCLCGFESDWMFKPNPNTKEKTGFFPLRTSQAAQGDIRVLAKKLETDINTLINIYYAPQKPPVVGR